jgi:RimJ/RimL family protein N-acetyltransferase
MDIRPMEETDAERFLALCQQLDGETALMLLEPGERSPDLEAQRTRIGAIRSSEREVVLVAELDGALAGFVGATAGMFRRSRGTAHLVVGVRSCYWGRGVGAALLEGLEAWARARGLHRLELTVMVHNTAAMALYRKRGFIIEGVRRESLLVDGRWVSERYMAKLLSAPADPDAQG